MIQQIHDFAKLVATYPESIQGQQQHFSSVVPTAEAKLIEALTMEFGEPELRVLRDVLIDHLGEDDT